ncbi:DUF4153 domain-containing protein [Salipaludibacillus sp. HK11]|uniref:DUF4153 domain-containing protein n=1 Tax=Salipaludibacillus sp. HK11 TaxID=3394320 RepID=UPI0039FBBE00
MSTRHIIYTFICLILAVLANITLLEEQIGISYSLFIIVFYSFFFYQFRKFTFTHKQISGLLFFVICVLSFSYFIYSNQIFYVLNFIIIPPLIFVHIVLVTSSEGISWSNIAFISLLRKKMNQLFKYGTRLTQSSNRKFKSNVNETTYHTGKKIGVGILIASPLVFLVLNLLLSADAQFQELMLNLPKLLINIDYGIFWTMIKIGILMLFFFCFFKIISKKTVVKPVVKDINDDKNWDAVILTTVLVSLNLLYLLFTIVQFQYFFSGTLVNDVSYAEYARRGFAELLSVTVINYLMILLTVRKTDKGSSKMIKIQLTLLILFSSVMLVSSFMRLMMYEQAFGFTYLRIFAHTFMIYLMVIYAFTLVKVWITRLPVARFYIIFSLLFYLGFNIIGIDSIIVKNNIERFEATEKIDVQYLDQLSYSAIPEVVELYKKHPDIDGLEDMLINKKEEINNEKAAWQSYNLSRENAKRSLNELDF